MSHAAPCSYPTASELEDSWRSVAVRAGARRRVIGRSREGRAIRAYEFGPTDAPRVLLTALIHGVELIGSVALRAAFERIAFPTRAEAKLAERYCFVVVPIVNPDALAENAARKARGERAFRRCNRAGVDLNRNFPAIGSRLMHPFSGSRYRFSPHYAGPHAFSEPETCALRDLICEAPPFLSLGFHSFGNLLLYPWGHTREPNPFQKSYLSLSRSFVKAQPRTRYGIRQASDFYPTSGDLDDWLQFEFDTLAFTVEVGTLDWDLLHPRRLLDPFSWHNPTSLGESVDNVVPGVLALLRAARPTPLLLENETQLARTRPLAAVRQA